MLLVDLVIAFVGLLIIAIILTALYGFIGAPYVPTPKFVARKMVELARLRGSEKVFDLGAGNGRILIEAKRRHPGITATGIEYAPTIWLLGRLIIFLSRQSVKLLLRDARNVDLREADVVFLYLIPKLMAFLEGKFNRELRPGTIVISHAFSFPHKHPEEVVVLRNWSGKKTLRRYVW